MSKSDLDARLQSRISAFVAEINSLVREAAVEAVQEALTGGGSARRSPIASAKARRAGTRKGGKRIRRSGAEVDALAAEALGAIQREAGRRLGEIAKELGVATKDVRRPVQTLLDGKRVKTTGQRGGTRYFPAGRAAAKAAPVKRAPKRKAKKTAKRK